MLSSISWADIHRGNYDWRATGSTMKRLKAWITEPLKGFYESIKASVEKAVNDIVLVIFASAGLVIIGSAVGIALYIPLHIAGVLVAAIGSVAGTAICTAVITKLIRKDGNQQPNLNDPNVTIERQRDEIQKLKESEGDLRKVLAERKLTLIKIEQFESTLWLEFQRCQTFAIDICEYPIREVPGGFGARNLKEDYLGILKATFTRAHGIDLRKVKFRNDEAGDLLISGVAPELRTSDVVVDEVVSGLRSSLTGGPLPNSITLDVGNASILQLNQEQRAGFEKTLRSGTEAKFLNDAFYKAAKGALGLLLAPLGRKITFVNFDLPDGLPLQEYLERHNREVADSMRRIERMLPSKSEHAA